MAELFINEVVHYYGKKSALNGINAPLENGVTALIGPNGAGKTTLINIIVGLLRPSQGSILFNGRNLKEWGKQYYTQIGYCPQTPRFYNNFTASEFLIYMGIMKGLKKEELQSRVPHYLELVNLNKEKNSFHAP